MAAPFSRSLRSLRADGTGRATRVLLLCVIAFGAWVAWFLTAEVELYETSGMARLSLDRAVHPIEATADGRLEAFRMRLGAAVYGGEELVVLDATQERLRVAEERTRLASLRAPTRRHGCTWTR